MASERVQRRVERLLDEADEAIARYEWERIRQAAQAVLALDPGNGDAQTFLAAAVRADGSGSATAVRAGAAPVQTAPAPAHPTSFANGRYAVKRFLGEGGKKKVYLAHDTLLDRDVAFALIKTEVLVPRFRLPAEARQAPP